MQALRRSVYCFLKELDIELAYYPAVLFLGTHQRDIKAHVYIDNFVNMFTAVFFIIATIRKQQIHTSVGTWLNKLWYIQIMQ